MVLHGYHPSGHLPGYRWHRHSNVVVVFERQCRTKNCVFRSAKLHNHALLELRTSGTCRCHIRRNPYRCNAPKETRELLSAALTARDDRLFAARSHAVLRPASVIPRLAQVSGARGRAADTKSQDSECTPDAKIRSAFYFVKMLKEGGLEFSAQPRFVLSLTVKRRRLTGSRQPRRNLSQARLTRRRLKNESPSSSARILNPPLPQCCISSICDIASRD